PATRPGFIAPSPPRLPSPSPVPPSPPAPDSSLEPSRSTALSTRTATAYSYVRHERGPELVSPNEVPSGWSPDPNIASVESVSELQVLRERLYQLAVHGCFVVGISSGSDAATSRAR